LTVNFSDVQAGLAGAYLVGSTVLHWPQGNLNQLPGFIEPGEWFDAGTPDDLSDDLWINGDHRLAAGSPCIQAGDPQFRQGPEVTDFEGHSRLLCTRVDLGAFEFGIGDFDCNARVDSLDFFQWRMCSADLRDEPYPAGCESLDFDFDGDVDLRDFAGLQVAWTGPGQ